jgi:WD40 repeat protein
MSATSSDLQRETSTNVSSCPPIAVSSPWLRRKRQLGNLELARWFSKDFPSFREGINDFRFSPDGQYIAVAERGSEVLICNVRTGQLVEKLTGDDGILCVAFMPDGTGLIGGGWGQPVRCWDVSFLGFGSHRMKQWRETQQKSSRSRLSGSLKYVNFAF